MQKTIYLFSGLGADERVFQQLDFTGFSVSHIKWVTPQEHETIEHYAGRLLPQVTTSQPILVGLSFGGMIAIEVAKQISTEKVILIASAKTKSEIPFYYRWAGKIGLHQVLPAKWLKQSNFITNWLFGAHSAFDKQLLRSILQDTDPVFLRWALDTIAKWNNQARPANISHIHGTADHILPLRFIDSAIEIKDGGHFMTVNKPAELTAAIRKLL